MATGAPAARRCPAHGGRNRRRHRGRASIVGLIYLDACLAIYLVEQHPHWAGLLERAMMAQTGKASFAVSPLVKCECLVGPFKNSDSGLQREFADFFAQHVSLAMPEAVYLMAAELRAHFGLRTPD